MHRNTIDKNTHRVSIDFANRLKCLTWIIVQALGPFRVLDNICEVKMRSAIGLLSGLVLTGCVADGSPSGSQPSKDELICIESGFVPGTLEFSQCLATAKIAREAAADYEKQQQKEREKRDTISDEMANRICVDYAKSQMPFPVIRNQSSPFNVNGGYEKTVKVSFELDNPKTSYSSRSAVCKIRGRDIVDFKIN